MRSYAARAAMGCLFEIYLHGDDRERLEGAAEEALAEIERLDQQLSHYRSDSDTARINALAASEWVRVEPALYRLLERCVAFSQITEGAFDITTGPLEKAWGFYRGEGRVPPDDEIAALLSRTGMQHVQLDPGRSAVRFASPGMELTFGAVGKGYALEAAAMILHFYDVKSAVLHAGQSTIYAMGAPPGAEGWEFTLRDPRDRETPLKTVLLRDQAISTSGDYEQFFEADGVRYSHIIDPRTGRPVQGMHSVWVIDSSATWTDALSTASFVLGPEWTREHCRHSPELQVVMVHSSSDGEGVQVNHFVPDREEWVCVATIRMKDAEAVSRALTEANVSTSMAGNRGACGVRVREQDRRRAVSILETDAKAHNYPIKLYP
jgi:FAD:protein FMN transferase